MTKAINEAVYREKNPSTIWYSDFFPSSMLFISYLISSLLTLEVGILSFKNKTLVGKSAKINDLIPSL